MNWMAQHCAKDYCCPQWVESISIEATDYFEDLMDRKKLFHAVMVDEKDLRELALTRTASKFGAVRRIKPQ